MREEFDEAIFVGTTQPPWRRRNEWRGAAVEFEV